MAKKTYDVVKFKEYTDGNGQVKSRGTTVGAAWEIDSGGMSVEIEDGISVTGRLAILPRKDKAE